jgi:hypothetical protein
MKKALRSKLTYANVMATIAVFLVLGGGAALAAGTFTAKQKKQVGKIATKVFNAKIGGASVTHAGSADTATKATTAAKATESTKATTATKADIATKAADAEKLGGRTPAEYQRKLKAGCAPPTSIAGLSNEGDVTCTSPVQAIRMTPAAGEDIAQNLGNQLQFLVACHDGGNVSVHFQNLSSNPATLNWFYGDAEAARASGVNISGGGEESFSFLSPGPKRIEGQFIYSTPSSVMTINLHAFDGTTFCEVRGTVETANG